MYLLLKKKGYIVCDSNEIHCPMNMLSHVDLCLLAGHLYYGQLFSKVHFSRRTNDVRDTESRWGSMWETRAFCSNASLLAV